MAMTRKDFQAIAKILDSNKARIDPDDFGWLCIDFADYCKQSNVNFNDSMFLDACGMEPSMKEQMKGRNNGKM